MQRRYITTALQISSFFRTNIEKEVQIYRENAVNKTNALKGL